MHLTYYVPLFGIERSDWLQERTVWKASKQLNTMSAVTLIVSRLHSSLTLALSYCAIILQNCLQRLAKSPSRYFRNSNTCLFQILFRNFYPLYKLYVWCQMKFSIIMTVHLKLT